MAVSLRVPRRQTTSNGARDPHACSTEDGGNNLEFVTMSGSTSSTGSQRQTVRICVLSRGTPSAYGGRPSASFHTLPVPRAAWRFLHEQELGLQTYMQSIRLTERETPW